MIPAFKSKKARERWLRSEEAWEEYGSLGPIRITQLNINDHQILRIERKYPEKDYMHYNHDIGDFPLTGKYSYSNLGYDEVDANDGIATSHTIATLVDLLIAEGY